MPQAIAWKTMESRRTTERRTIDGSEQLFSLTQIRQRTQRLDLLLCFLVGSMLFVPDLQLRPWHFLPFLHSDLESRRCKCSDISALVMTILLSAETRGNDLPNEPSGGCQIANAEEELVEKPACGQVDHQLVGRQSFSVNLHS